MMVRWPKIDRKGVATFLVVVPTIVSILFGINFYPYFTYLMYSQNPHHWENSISVVGVSPEGKEFPILAPKLLWPIGPNGITINMYLRLREGATDIEMRPVLAYFANRYLYYHHRGRPFASTKLTKIFVRQHKTLWPPAEVGLEFPIVRWSYETN